MSIGSLIWLLVAETESSNCVLTPQFSLLGLINAPHTSQFCSVDSHDATGRVRQNAELSRMSLVEKLLNDGGGLAFIMYLTGGGVHPYWCLTGDENNITFA